MNLACNPDFVLRLSGPLRLLRCDGSDATPRVAKGQGILALLGASPALRRPRAWIQDKLWSDRPPGNGSASLRQTLHRLRQEVGGDQRWLVTNAGWMALDPTRVSVVTEPAPEDKDALGTEPEFCEGLDIADPEFEDWIRDHRLAQDDRAAARHDPSLRRSSTEAVPPPLALLVLVPPNVDGNALRALAELLCMEVATWSPSDRGAPPAWTRVETALPAVNLRNAPLPTSTTAGSRISANRDVSVSPFKA